MSCKSLKISEMPNAIKLMPEDLLPIVQNGQNKVTTLENLLSTFEDILKPHPHPCPDHPCPEPRCGGKKDYEALYTALQALDEAKKAKLAADTNAVEIDELKTESASHITSVIIKLSDEDVVATVEDGVATIDLSSKL